MMPKVVRCGRYGEVLEGTKYSLVLRGDAGAVAGYKEAPPSYTAATRGLFHHPHVARTRESPVGEQGSAHKRRHPPAAPSDQEPGPLRPWRLVTWTPSTTPNCSSETARPYPGAAIDPAKHGSAGAGKQRY
jgi:hypothetical protein